MQDLYGIIRRAPEVRRCMMKRLFEYFVGEDQVMDPGYLESMTQAFSKEASVNSSHAFKGAVKRILLSNTFRQVDRDSKLCYDRAPGSDPSGRPPCQAAYLLENNCESCHSGAKRKGGLDLSGWVELEKGKMGFKHEEVSSGKPIPMKVTLKKILDSLTENDPKKRMPLHRYMNPLDRQDLYLWAEAALRAEMERGAK
jgi:hypothetical protein